MPEIEMKSYRIGGLYGGPDIGPQDGSWAMTYRKSCTYFVQTPHGFFMAMQDTTRNVLVFKFLGLELTLKTLSRINAAGRCRWCDGTKKVQLFATIVDCQECK